MIRLYHLPLSPLRGPRRVWGKGSSCLIARDPKPVSAVVFVHGFGDHPERAWDGFPSRIPCRLAFKRADVFFFGYESRKQSASTSADQLLPLIRSLAEAPATDVINPSLPSFASPRDSSWSYSKVVLVGYSLGAIVIRLALLQLTHARHAWLSKCQLCLFAPAHHGASVLPLALGSLGELGELLGQGNIARLTINGIKRKWNVLEDLEPGCTTLSDLKSDTKDVLSATANRHLVARVLHGEKDKIVKKHPFLQDQHAEPLANADHLAVPKPTRVGNDPILLVESML